MRPVDEELVERKVSDKARGEAAAEGDADAAGCPGLASETRVEHRQFPFVEPRSTYFRSNLNA
jgi:hypothetical protein